MGVRRFDFASFDVSKLERTPTGGLVIQACLTRTGVFEYKTQTGQVIREYRPRESVFEPQSLASLAHAAVTHLHPVGMVTPENYEELAKGSVVPGSITEEGSNPALLNAKLTVQTADTIDLVLRKELLEVSCGYSCDIIEQSGTSPEGPYDRIQTNIRYNHVALGPEGWGRAGEICSIKLDGGGDLCIQYTHLPLSREKAKERMKHKIEKQKNTLRVDGVEFNLRTKSGRENGQRALENIVENLSVEVRNIRKDDSADAIAMLEQVLMMLKAMAGPMAEPSAEPMVDAEAAPAPAKDPNEKDQQAKDADSAPAQDPNAEIEKRADERASIIERAKLLNPKVETKGRTNAQIMSDALGAHNIRVDGSEERLRGAFDTFQAPRVHSSLRDARGSLGNNNERADSGDDAPTVSLEQDHKNRAATAWRKNKVNK